MSRYQPTNEPVVSVEGLGDIFGKLGSAISRGWKNMQRNMALNRVRIDAEYRPELNGVAYKTYPDFIAGLKSFVNSGDDFDATVNVIARYDTVNYTATFETENGPVQKQGSTTVGVTKTAIIIRRDGKLYFRLPGYESGDVTANVMTYVYADAGLH